MAAAQLAALGWMESPATSRNGFPLDDAWIHQVVARTFATTGTLGYAPGQHGAGATSFLWALTLSLNPRFVHGSAPLYTLAVNGALYLLVGQLWLGLLLRVRGDDPIRGERPHRILIATLATVLGTIGGNFVWYAASGMESLMLAAFSLLAITFATRSSGRRSLVVAGAFAGLAGLTRPEAFPLGLVLPIGLLAVGRSRRRALLVLPGWALAAAIYAGVNFVATGKLSPATLAGRKWLWVEENAGLGFVDRTSDFVDTWIGRLREYTLGTSSLVAMWIAIGIAAAGLGWLALRARSGLRIALLWMAVHTGTFLVLLPTPGHGGRYQPWLPLVFGTTLVLGGDALVRGLVRRVPALVARARRVAPTAAVVVAIPWFALTVVGLRDWQTDQLSAVRHVDATERGMGIRVNQLDPNAVVASFDIGGIGYDARRTIVDVGGLSDPSFVGLFATGAVSSYLRKTHVDYVVLPLPYEEDLPVLSHFGYRLHLTDDPGLVLEPVTELMSDLAQWGPGVGATWNASPKQVLFHVSYVGDDARFEAAPTDGPVTLAVSGLPMTRRERGRLEHSLRILDGAGLPVTVEANLGAAAANDGDTEKTTIACSAQARACTFHLAASLRRALGGAAVEVAIGKAIDSATKRYFDSNDTLGAASVSLRVFADLAGQRRTERPRPLLPPARLPTFNGVASRDWDSLSWGATVAVAIFAAIVWIAGLHRAKARRDEKAPT